MFLGWVINNAKIIVKFDFLDVNFISIVTSDGFYCSVSVEPDVVALGYTGLKLYTYSFATNIYF